MGDMYAVDFAPLLEQLARYSSSEGVIGQIRFYEDHAPELLISESGTLVRMALEPNEVRAVQAYMPR